MRIILICIMLILLGTCFCSASLLESSSQVKTRFIELFGTFEKENKQKKTFSIIQNYHQNDRIALSLTDFQVNSDISQSQIYFLSYEVRVLEGSRKITLEVNHRNLPSQWLIAVNYIIIGAKISLETIFLQNVKIGDMPSAIHLTNGMLLTTSEHTQTQEKQKEEGGFDAFLLQRGFESEKSIDANLLLQVSGEIKIYFIREAHIHIQKGFSHIKNYFLTILIINKAKLTLSALAYQTAPEQTALQINSSLTLTRKFKTQKCKNGISKDYYSFCWKTSSEKQLVYFHKIAKNQQNIQSETNQTNHFYQILSKEDVSTKKGIRLLDECEVHDEPQTCTCDITWPNAEHCYEDNMCACKIGQCADGYYTAGSLVSTCSQCPATLTNCTDCSLKVGSTTAVCTSCASGYMVLNGTCTACPLGCEKCTTYTVGTSYRPTCLLCLATFKIVASGQSYVCVCPANTSLNRAVSPVSCDGCPSICSACTSTTDCTSCVAGYYLIVSTCTACMPVCQTCTTASTCTSCDASFVNLTSICTCLSPLFFDMATKTCLSCSSIISNCATCWYSTPFDPASPTLPDCFTAAPGYYIDSVTSSILPCIDYCLNCDSAPAIMCSTPAANFIFDTVTSTCMCDPTLFFSVTANTCLPCSQAVPGCAACQNTTIPSSTLCNACDSGYFSPTPYPSTACTTCPTYCTGCTALNACTSCTLNLTVLADGTCGCYSADDLFLNPTSLYCQSCSSVIFNCQSCSSTGFTVTCATCVAGNYQDSTGLNCIPCPTTCYTCLNSTYCTSCEAGYELDSSNQCICGTSCSDCMTNSSGTCASCTYGPFTCLSCIIGYTNTSGTCQLCNATWPLCVQCTSTCLACEPTFTLSSLGCGCNNTAGLYLSVNSSLCLLCIQAIPQCTSCSSIPTICLNCSLGYYVSSSQVCSPCTDNCLTCSGTPSHCDSCLITYSMVSAFTCACDNSAGYFYDASTGGCSACSVLFSNCLTCVLNVTNQTQCTACADSFFWDNTTSTCLACSSACYNCSGFAYCTSCSAGLIPVAGSCVCDNTTIPPVYLDSSSGTCQECSIIIAGCTSCSDNNSAIICNSCASSTYLINNTCTNCPFQCATCDSSGCLSCPGNLTLTNGSCVCDSSCSACNTLSAGCLSCSIVSNVITMCFSCSPNTYLSSPNCQPCPATCATCTSSSNCLTCLPTFVLLSGQCSCATTLGMFPNNAGSCSSCSTLFYACSQCSIVSGDTVCTACSAGYYLDGAGTCLPCDISCPTCSGSSATCSSCPAGETLSPSNTCVCSSASCLACSALSAHCTQCIYTTLGNFSSCATCDTGYYVKGGSCSACPSACKLCGTNGACLTCAATFEVINDTCMCNSANNMYYTNGSCAACNAIYLNCEICVQNASVALNVSCSQCKTGYYQNNSLCVGSVCGDGNITSGQACDDDNQLDGDGCSSLCQIQTYFTCVGSPSACTVNINFNITPTTIEVSQTLCNTVTIQFQLSPFYDSFDSADFKNMLGFVSEVRLVYKSWSYSKGKVKYDFEYTGTLVDAYTTFFFDPAALQVSETNSMPIINVAFRLKSTNNILMVYYEEQICQSQAKVEAVTRAIQYASYGTLIASALPCKIVGLELFGVLQLAHINVGNMDNVNTMMTPLMGMKGVHGFTLNLGDQSKSSSSRLLQSGYTPARVESIGYESNFLRNCNVMLFIVITVLLVSAILYSLTYCCQSCAPTLHSISKRMIKEVLLTLLLFNCYNFAYSAGIHFNYAPKDDYLYTVGTIAAVLSVILPILMALGLMCSKDEGFGQYKQKFKPGVVEKLYFVATIIYRSGIGLYISTMNQDQLSTLIVMALSIAFLLYNLVNLPYKKAYHNYRANICHFTQFISLFVAMYYRSMKSTTSRSTVAKVFAPAYIQLTFIGLSLLVSIIVLSYEIYLFAKQCLQKNKNDKVNESSVHHTKNLNTVDHSQGDIDIIDEPKQLYDEPVLQQ